MSWYAVDAIEDALDATRGFLLPFDLRRWLKLAVIVFFLGGGGGGGGAPSAASNGVNFSVGPDEFPMGGFPGEFEIPLLAVAVVGVVVALALVFGLVGAVMRFVLLDALRTRAVRITEPFGRWFGSGLRLFAFVLALVLLFLLPIAAGVAGAFALTPLVVLFVVPVALVLGLVLAVVGTFTYDFVVPVMMVERVGVLDGWRRLWPTLRNQWKQFGVYLLVRIVVAFAAGILVSIVLGVVGIPVALLFGAVAFGVFAGGAPSLVALAVLVVVGLPFLLLLLAAALAVQIPVQTYLGYLALLVLGDANAEFDLIPEYRAEIRARESGGV